MENAIIAVMVLVALGGVGMLVWAGLTELSRAADANAILRERAQQLRELQIHEAFKKAGVDYPKPYVTPLPQWLEEDLRPRKQPQRQEGKWEHYGEFGERRWVPKEMTQ